MGISNALYSNLTIKNGRVEQGNFGDYLVARDDIVPETHVHIVESGASPGGVGEPGVRVPKSVLLSPFVQLLNVLPLVVVDTDFKRTESPLPPNPGMLTVPLEALIATV